jgi:hypothetical protein
VNNKICKHVINPFSENPECTCYGKNQCHFQNPDYNPDGKINVVICEKYISDMTMVGEDHE